MRGRVRGDNLHGVATIRQKARVERIVTIGEIILQQQPARFAIAAVIHGEHELIVVVVMRRPANGDRIAITDGGRHRVKTGLPGYQNIGASPMRNGLVAIAGLHRNVVDFRRNVLGQIVEQNILNARSGIAGAEHGLPLHEARGWNF